VDDREYRLRQILIGVREGASPDALVKAQARGEQVLSSIASGADFAALAIQYSDGREALEGGDLGWRRPDEIPSAFAEVVRTLSPGESSDLIRSPAGFHILKVEDIRGGGVRTVTQTHARHILVRPNEVVSSAEARLRLERLVERIQGGADFEELARANSEDPGSARRGGDLGWASPGQFDPVFEQEMNKLAPGQVSAPFQSSFGWHIVQVMDRREVDDSDGYERNQAREVLLRRKAEDEWELYLRRLRDEAYVDYRINV
jgi:peptidyl-prolyl cis-trans isomerase SurA